MCWAVAAVLLSLRPVFAAEVEENAVQAGRSFEALHSASGIESRKPGLATVSEPSTVPVLEDADWETARRLARELHSAILMSTAKECIDGLEALAISDSTFEDLRSFIIGELAVEMKDHMLARQVMDRIVESYRKIADHCWDPLKEDIIRVIMEAVRQTDRPARVLSWTEDVVNIAADAEFTRGTNALLPESSRSDVD